MKKDPIERELDYNYKIFVFEQINGAGSDTKRRWITYENILEELYNMGEYKLIDEIKYRISDKEDDKKVFLSSLKKIKNKTSRLNLLLNSF
tara:strand:- start:563 stop:835 length:273 start_codon:yes stop_codon:yes gene_type:complete